ncbi:hypothetical protein DAEQUDRAFT_664449 [Daedalea quercina L-15889]|uniref:Uncharacterized protein n=1 Tax=Daedalea quercina L-15889 TaxID=1314783 RepID=A0A165SQG0_9APHY|nr:hypothetical protein DAEQUDRAFT_664449 [Daedalea quercina L-15889]
MPREIYMNIPEQNPRNAASFEERRVQDYLNAYRTTGRSPTPCPSQPTNPAQRAALGLPPHIEPYSEIVNSNTDSVMDDGPSSSSITINGTRPGAIRDMHGFRPQPVTGETSRDAVFQSIVCQPEFLAWSFEVRMVHYSSWKRK